MFAIIQTGGKQFRVEKGMRLQVEKLAAEAGSDIEIPQVLLVSPDEGEAKIGTPFVENSKVLATVLRQLRAPKVMVFKKRSKKGYKKTQGHRQSLTEIEIKEVVL